MSATTAPAPFSPAELAALPSILRANLAALERTSAAAALRIARTPPRADLTWLETPQGPACAVHTWGPLGEGFGEPTLRYLCSQRRPVQEAHALANTINALASAALIVLGFGCGHHIAALAGKLGQSGVVVVYEPDIALLRAVLERIDCTTWLKASNTVIVLDAHDDAALSTSLIGAEPLLAMGTTVIEHQPSLALWATQSASPDAPCGTTASAATFRACFQRVMRAIRTTLVTTLAQARATIRNLTQNIDHYALGDGIAPLHNALAGRPAIVVAAGPSLARNVHLLAQPGVRERFCIIAAQTVLKPLLAAGIKPHFVCALDFAEISERFYQGLTQQETDGITLVIEPKVNPAVPSAAPLATRDAASGRAISAGMHIRCASDEFLEELLGPTLSREMGRLPSGATVAHLCHYLARYLGCDPVLLIGQDLAFTDDRYYGPNAAIAEVWAGELSEVQTLEMLQWQRLMRQRGLLRRVPARSGGDVYTDEQMATYLVQFQRDFAADAAGGLCTIDCTEGGCIKLHTEPMPLAQALRTFGPASEAQTASIADALAAACQASQTADSAAPSAQRRAAVRAQLRTLQRDCTKIADGANHAADLLGEMLTHHTDQPRVNDLIGQVYTVRDAVTKLRPAYTLVERLNQTGVFNRHRTDRTLRVSLDTDELAKQAAQIRRDQANVRAIADAASQLGTLLARAGDALDGAPKIVRETLSDLAPSPAHGERPPRVLPIVVARSSGGPLAAPAALTARFGDCSVLAATTERALTIAARTTCGPDAKPLVVVITDDPAWCRSALGPLASHAGVCILPHNGPLNHFDPSLLAAARASACDSWRAGIAGLTCYDECFPSVALLRACGQHSAAAALLIDGACPLIDIETSIALVCRYREDPASHRLTFTQAAPGLAPIVLDVGLIQQLIDNRTSAGTHSSIGGLLSYVPVAPMADPISNSMCVRIAPAMRDALCRAVMDTPARATHWLAVLSASSLCPTTVTGAQAALALAAAGTDPYHVAHADAVMLAADEVTLNLRADYIVGSEQYLTEWLAQRCTTPAASTRRITLLTDAATPRESLERTLSAIALLAATAATPCPSVQIRTDLRGGPDEAATLNALAAAHPHLHAVHVDIWATDRATLATIHNTNEQAATSWIIMRDAGLRLLRTEAATPLIVPRMRKDRRTMKQIPEFYDAAILGFGWGIIDGPPPEPAVSSTNLLLPLPLLPLGVPAIAAQRLALQAERAQVTSHQAVPA